MSKVSHR